MSSKRKSVHNASATSRLNFRPTFNDSKFEPKGTKPTTSRSSVKEIFTLMVLHCCKKSLFFDTNLKVGIYLGALFLVSLIADFVSVPKGYLSRSDNAFNKYFVKFAWGWNLMLLVPYVVLTAYVYCCGLKDRIVKHHLLRIVVATFFWWFWTSLFNYIEAAYGKCNVKGEQFNTKKACLQGGHFWNGFDLSGHSFILIYGSLLLIEETRSMISWDSIKEYIRLEDHYRSSRDTSHNTNPLRSLSDEHFKVLQESYEKFTPYIRGIFIAITVFQVLWDVMLVCTMLYYHIMIEKFLGGAIAILTWFFTYRVWYNSPSLLPRLPGDGLFRYIKNKQIAQTLPTARRRTGSIVNNSNVPMFMGRPIYATQTSSTEVVEDSGAR